MQFRIYASFICNVFYTQLQNPGVGIKGQENRTPQIREKKVVSKLTDDSNVTISIKALYNNYYQNTKASSEESRQCMNRRRISTEK